MVNVHVLAHTDCIADLSFLKSIHDFFLCGIKISACVVDHGAMVTIYMLTLPLVLNKAVLVMDESQ